MTNTKNTARDLIRIEGQHYGAIKIPYTFNGCSFVAIALRDRKVGIDAYQKVEIYQADSTGLENFLGYECDLGKLGNAGRRALSHGLYCNGMKTGEFEF
jgi:hypothetical protein